MKRPIDPKLHHGLVRIKHGQDAGRVGYFDDDRSDTAGVVYWGIPWRSEYAIVHKERLENVSALDAAHAGWPVPRPEPEGSA